MRIFDKRKLSHIEWLLPFIVLAISLFGLLAIIMATASPFTGEELTLDEILANLNLYSFSKQLIWVGIGFAAMLAVMFIDYRFYSKIWLFLLGLSVALLVLVILFGVVRGGTKGWFKLGEDTTFQPSEVVKLATIVLLAKFLSKGKNKSFRELLPALGIFALIIGVLALQKDIGTMTVYVFILFCMLFASGARLRHMAVPLGVLAVATVVFWFFVMGDEQKSRILNFNNPDQVQQLKNSLIAIGSGQFGGKGLFSMGAMSQLSYIPEIETDFIFSVIGESVGFVGCLALLIMFFLLIFRLWQLMSRTRDKFGSLIVAGVMSLFMFHIFENIAMTIGVMPITGIPLPFISYGGTNYVTNAIGIGLVLSVCYYRPNPLTD